MIYPPRLINMSKLLILPPVGPGAMNSTGPIHMLEQCLTASIYDHRGLEYCVLNKLQKLSGD